MMILQTALGRRVVTILVVSGFCSLVYQVTWLRLLRLVFGLSTAASAAVVAIFMGGLGLGGWLIGRRLQKIKNPLEFYSRLELGIALSAAATPWLVDLATAIYFPLGGVSALGVPLATLLRLMLSTFVLGLATTLMGGTLPTICHALRQQDDLGRRGVAWLYGSNTFGAVVGAFTANFFMLELFGIRQSLWLACLVNLLLALYARQLARQSEKILGTSEKSTQESALATSEKRTDSTFRFVLVAAALVGAIFFLMELVWYRMLSPILGGSSYTFGLILAIALLGIALGGLAYAFGSSTRRPTLASFALTCVLEALCLILPFALGDSLAWFAATLRSLSAVGFSGLVAGWTLVACLTILPAAIIAGYQFPLLVALLGNNSERVGYEVGLTYAWNTGGAILGSLAGGFGLLPLLGAPWLWRFCTLLLLVLAFAALLLHRRSAPERRRAASWPALLTGLLALVLCLSTGPTAFWRHASIGAGRLDVDLHGPNDLRREIHEHRKAVLYEAEGVESSIALMSRQQLTLQVNGKSDGSARGDAATQVMSGLIGALLHPKFETGLVIGMGTGSTAGWMAAVPTCQKVDIVELEPAVVRFADQFRHVNADLMNSPKVRTFHGDGREYVLSQPATYDVIFSEPSNPYRAGVADLFSYDFYLAAAKRLTPRGIFLQWLQGYEADAQTIQTVLATFGASFPHAEIWQVDARDLILVASNEPIHHDFDRIRQQVDTEPFKSALRWTWGVEGLAGFYSGFLGGQSLITTIANQAVGISSDDRPRIEFSFARNVGRRVQFEVEDLRNVARRLDDDRPKGTGQSLEWRRVEDYRQLRASQGHGTFLRSAIEAATGDRRQRYLARNAYSAGALRDAHRLWFQQVDPEPKTHLDLQLVAEVLADQGDAAADGYIDRLALLAPTEAVALRSRLAWRRGSPQEALVFLVETLERFREDGWFHYALSLRTLQWLEEVARQYPPAAPVLFEALEQPFTSYLHEFQRLRLRIDLARDPKQCVSAFAAWEPHIPWEKELLAKRVECYDRADHVLLDRAWNDLQTFNANTPVDFRVELEP